MAAGIGITTPIALCYLVLFLGFGYGALETFIVGAALSTTSIGTTFIVISNSADVDLTHTKVGTVLVSAALFDDVVGLIMVSVISNLGGIQGGGGTNIGWIVGRPIVASFAIGAISPLLAKYVAGPLYRRLLEKRVASLGHKASICIMTLVLSAHIVICAYAGASLLFGAFLAGAFLNALPSHIKEPVQLEGGGLQEAPGFHDAFEEYVSGAQSFILEPLFFASIGFAIPFKRLHIDNMKVTKIYVYPIKSLRPIALQQAKLDRQGVQYDRRFMLLKVHDDGHLEPIEVVRFPACALFEPEIVGDKIIVKYIIPEEPLFPPTPEQKTTLEVPLEPDTSGLDQVEVDLYNSKCMGYRMPEHYSSWFSSCLGFESLLVYVGDSRRPILGSMSPHTQKQQKKGWLSSMANYVTGSNEEDPHKLTFTCVAAYLITSEASVNDVSSKLPPGEEMDMRKFRPNIVIDGEEAFDEDFWGEIEIGSGPRFVLTGNCGRCLSVNVDYKTGRPGTGEVGNVLKKMMKYRRVDLGNKYAPVFGRYGFLTEEEAEIQVGAEVTVTQRLEERRVWDWPGA
ncbi:hypothetical protein VMCG_05041 [Cytospora schulzeri]|uniref:MOSC domain-containing protein n=1 Tax=Cytospora schulzeri TaxID=448051 RepID=A0A423WMI3_9PEZI|nr:hypothetical protein VMCG_05041 [Valsa malicola]